MNDFNINTLHGNIVVPSLKNVKLDLYKPDSILLLNLQLSRALYTALRNTAAQGIDVKIGIGHYLRGTSFS